MNVAPFWGFLDGMGRARQIKWKKTRAFKSNAPETKSGPQNESKDQQPEIKCWRRSKRINFLCAIWFGTLD